MGTNFWELWNRKDQQSIIKKRISSLKEIEDIIHNDITNLGMENDKVIDLQDVELWHKIATIERAGKYKILLNEENKIILKHKADIQTKIIWDDERFFAASFRMYSKWEETRWRYIKDSQTNKVITQALEATHINDVKYNKESNLYLIEMSDNSTLNGYKHVWLFNEKGSKIDEGGIKILEKDLYIKKIWRWDDHERVADVYFNKIEKDDNNNQTIKTLFQWLQIPSDYGRHKDNYFEYMGDGIVIESAPRWWKNVPSNSYNGEFGQAIDIFSPEKRKSPEYTGKTFFISKETFGIMPQVYPEGDKIYSPREDKFRAPYINVVNFNGEIITQKPYCYVKKIGNTYFAKPIKNNMIHIADRMDTHIHQNANQEEINKQYIKDETIKWHKERIIIDPQTLDPVENNELFIDIQIIEWFLECEKECWEIVIYDTNGNRKADNIKSYKTLQGQIYECTSISWERIFFDKQRDKIDL